MELPPAAGAGAGALSLHAPPGGGAADRFAWMAEPGVYAGRLSVDGAEEPSAADRPSSRADRYVGFNSLACMPGGAASPLPRSRLQPNGPPAGQTGERRLQSKVKQETGVYAGRLSIDSGKEASAAERLGSRTDRRVAYTVTAVQQWRPFKRISRLRLGRAATPSTARRLRQRCHRSLCVACSCCQQYAAASSSRKSTSATR